MSNTKADNTTETCSESDPMFEALSRKGLVALATDFDRSHDFALSNFMMDQETSIGIEYQRVRPFYIKVEEAEEYLDSAGEKVSDSASKILKALASTFSTSVDKLTAKATNKISSMAE